MEDHWQVGKPTLPYPILPSLDPILQKIPAYIFCYIGIDQKEKLKMVTEVGNIIYVIWSELTGWIPDKSKILL